MSITKSHDPEKCANCRKGQDFAIPFTMAFQPIVDVRDGSVYAYEALVRGPNGEGAFSVLSQIGKGNRYGFDQACRIKAITLASQLGLQDTGALLSINFLPNAVYDPLACIQTTLRTAQEVSFPLDRIVFEFTENEEVADPGHLKRIIAAYKEIGFHTAIDDFGAGFSNLGLLTKFQPDVIKLDMELIRGIDTDPVRQAIVAGMVGICRVIGIRIVAEGIETEAERDAVAEQGVALMQGYLFARPAVESLPLKQAVEVHPAQAPSARAAA